METYDYIIVGAGPAGCVLAERLSASGKLKVLVLEAGPSDRVPHVKIPAAFTKLFGTSRDWGFRTAPEPALLGRRLSWPRGKMVGGSASMNAHLYVRGHRDDYDEWARAGNVGWSHGEVMRHFERIEGFAGQAAGYGTGGLQRIETQRDPRPVTERFLAACAELGLPRRAHAGGDEEGAGHALVMQRGGVRFSAADAFLRPALRRANVRMHTEAHVRRVLFAGARATGVEVARRGRVYRVACAGEVIASGGAIGSPQLLLRSGVGPRADLLGAALPCIADVRGVGEHLADHLMAVVVRGTREPISLASAESPGSVLRYLLAKRGMLTSCVAEAAAFVRSRPELDAPDLELVFAPVPFIDHGAVKPAGHGVSIGVVLLTPESRGRVQLDPRDPHGSPYIQPRYLSDPAGRDLATLVRGLELAQRVFEAPPLRQVVDRFIEPPRRLGAREELAAFVREQAETIYHPVGTCRMGDGPSDVVDARLRVRGVEGLRVVDASIMPRIVRGHTCAATLMIADKAAEMLLEDRATRATRRTAFAEGATAG